MPIRIKLPSTARTAVTAGGCKPCDEARERAMRDAENIAGRRPQAAASRRSPGTFRESPVQRGTVTWSGPLIFEGQMTGDGRYIQNNALRWDTLPVPLRYVENDTGEHNGAQVVGHINTIARRPGGVIWGTGDFDTNDISVEAARKVHEKLQNGVSADLDDVSFTVKVAAEMLGELTPDDAPAEPEVDENGRITVLDIDSDAEVMDIDDARIRAATIVQVPAFEGARITLDSAFPPADGPADQAPAEDGDSSGTMPDGSPCSCDEDDDDFDPDCSCDEEPGEEEGDVGHEPPTEEAALVAAAIPMEPPAGWFTDPELPGPTPLTITDSGAVYGHLAIWGTCHRSFANTCVTPPRSATGYSHFRVGAVMTREGREIPVGHITLDTFHADKALSAASAAAHYENTGATVADVAVGDDDWGIWVAGALRPGTTPEQVRKLRASPLSGDWRAYGGNLELVAALAVNVPGFPVPRAEGLVAAGRTTALVASGIVAQRPALRTRRARGSSQTQGRRRQRSEDDISAEALAWLQQKTAPIHRKAQLARIDREVKLIELDRDVRR